MLVVSVLQELIRMVVELGYRAVGSWCWVWKCCLCVQCVKVMLVD